jgi:hypothetical protein
VKGLMPVIYKSSLRVIHLNNNAISKDTKRFIFNSLMQDFTETKRLADVN